MSDFTSEVRDGMRIDWDVPVAMDDGLVVRADGYRPIPDGHLYVSRNSTGQVLRPVVPQPIAPWVSCAPGGSRRRRT